MKNSKTTYLVLPNVIRSVKTISQLILGFILKFGYVEQRINSHGFP